MTEAEWLSGADPTALWAFVCDERGCSRTPAGRRKLRLFACACLRDIWDLLRQPGSRHAVVRAESFADGSATRAELADVARSARAALAREEIGTGLPHWQAAEAANHVAVTKYDGGSHPSVRHAAVSAAYARAHDPCLTAAHADKFQTEFRRCLDGYAGLFRDIFGNPFRPVGADPAWLTSTVVQLAAGAYADRAFDRLPILADALQDAGCDHPDVLAHCRDPHLTHVRGCWVVDLVLGKA